MMDYRFHWWPPSRTIPHVACAAQSAHHGAALALKRFMAMGNNLRAPGAHVDFTDAGGNTHTLLVDEVLDWLKEPQQTGFVEREYLEPLVNSGA
jgi:hypothetical protein